MRTRNNGNRFIEQYEWIGVCITVQIGELGKFTDMQIGERGKQRVTSHDHYKTKSVEVQNNKCRYFRKY